MSKKSTLCVVCGSRHVELLKYTRRMIALKPLYQMKLDAYTIDINTTMR